MLLSLPLFAANGEAGRNPNDPLDQGGETCATAPAITTIPYCDSGTTLGHVNDYVVPCNTPSVAPDVVYTITPPVTSVLSFSLCGSAYNTALTIWRGCPTAGGQLICCSDNVCGDDACCSGITLLAGVQYFVVVDGGVGGVVAGNYVLNVVQGQSCPETPCQNVCPFESLDFEPANNNCGPNAPSVTCGDTLCGVISAAADRDWYRFNFTQFPCADVHIAVYGNDTPGHFPFGQGLNPKVSVWTADCTTMLAQDDDGGVGLDALLDSLCIPAGSYNILVESSAGTGPYELWIWCTSCQCVCPYPNFDIEPNNICSGGGGVISCGDTVCGYQELGANDYYYFRVLGPGCQNVTIDVFGNDTPGQYPFGQGLNPRVTLYTPGCVGIAGDANSGVGEDARIDSLCLAPGTYRLHVIAEPQATNFGPYVIATSCTPCQCADTCDYPNRDFEGVNNSCGTFNPPMACGDTLCGELSVNDVVDWYLITVVGPGSIRLKVDVFGNDTPGFYPFGLGLNPRVSVVGVGCTSVLGNDNDGGIGEDSHLEICLSQGTYNIAVTADSLQFGPYILATACAPCDTCPYPDFDVEPLNNSCGTINEILHCNDARCGEIFGTVAPDQDWYVLQLTECRQLFIDVLGNDTPGFYPFGHGLNTAVELWSADCSTMLYQDFNSGVGEDARLNTPCIEPGIYMLRIYGEVGTQGPYIIFVGCEACQCGPPCEVICPTGSTLENEPCPSFVDSTNGGCNTEPQHFLPLQCNQVYCGTGFATPNYVDTDWYRLLVTSPSQVRLCVTSEFDGYLNLYVRGPRPNGCDALDLVDCIYVVGCQGIQCISDCLPRGIYYAEFRPAGFQNVNCWDYTLAAVCSDCQPTVCEAPDSVVISYPDLLDAPNPVTDITLRWPPVPGATEYRIHRVDNNTVFVPGPGNYVAATSDTFYTHPGVIAFGGADEVWIYYVVAYCAYNHEPCDVVPAAVRPEEPRIIAPRE